jgi:CBS domain-containing membrane protein
MRVENLMSSPVVSLLSDQTLPFASEIMSFRHIRHLPVVDRLRRVVGLISHRDLLKWADTMAELRREHRDDLLVEQVMTRDVWTVGPDTAAADAGRVMLECKIGCAPVVDACGFLIGIVTASDFLRIAVDAIDTLSGRRTLGAVRELASRP